MDQGWPAVGKGCSGTSKQVRTRDHAGDGLRRAGVHALHIAVGDGGVLDPDVERVLAASGPRSIWCGRWPCHRRPPGSRSCLRYSQGIPPLKWYLAGLTFSRRSGYTGHTRPKGGILLETRWKTRLRGAGGGQRPPFRRQQAHSCGGGRHPHPPGPLRSSGGALFPGGSGDAVSRDLGACKGVLLYSRLERRTGGRGQPQHRPGPRGPGRLPRRCSSWWRTSRCCGGRAWTPS